MKKPNVVILNITHGDNPYMEQPPFLPIAAGACRTDIMNDARGEENISTKNKWYGDFTSLYWAWKNLKDVDIIGTSHYRRYLADDDVLNRWQFEYSLSWEKFSNRRYNTDHLVKILDKCDFVMLKEFIFQTTTREQYIQCHHYPQNLDYVTKALEKIHPESVDIWKNILEKKSMQPGYLFLTRWEKFNELCEWLYPVLVDIEKQIDIAQYEGYQSRVIAFLYERLVPVFIVTKNYRIEQRSMYLIEKESKLSVGEYKRLYRKEQCIQIKRKIKKIVKSVLGGSMC